MSLAETITRRMGGSWHGSYGTYPGEGHSKKDRSVSIKDAPDKPEGVVIKCHAPGDDWRNELDRLRAANLIPAFDPRGGQNDNRPMFGKQERKPGVSYFEYQNGSGETVCRKVRTDPGKNFIWQHPNGKGGWAKGRGCDSLPYRLPDLLNAPADAVIYVAEGEAKADKLARWGLVATSSKDLPNDLSVLQGRTVAILPDNDSQGEKIANALLASLKGIAERAVLVELPGLPPMGDIIDWIGTADELRALTADALAAPVAGKLPLAFRKGVSARALMAKHFDPIRWIVPGYVPEGFYVLAGAPKQGKSWLVLNWMLAIGNGGKAMGSIDCEAGDVLGLMLEDNERRLQRRLKQMRLMEIPERVTLLTEWPTLDEGCLDEIEAWIAQVPNPRLIVVDVFARVKGTKTGKETDYDFDYRQAALLQSVASRHNLAVVVIHHTRKMAADDPFDEVSGTRGLTGAADGVLVLKKDSGSQQPVLYGRGRDLEEIETALQFDGETGTWSILGAAWLVADTMERREIQQVLGRSVDPMTPTEIGERLGKSRQNISKMLAKMYDEGQVEKVSTGRYVLVSPVSPFTSPHDTKETRETTSYHTRAEAAE